MLTEIGAAFRQWRQPREFRIAAPHWPAEALAALAAARDDRPGDAPGLTDTAPDPADDTIPGQAPAPADKPGTPGGTAPPGAVPSEGALADLAVHLWRLGNRIDTASGGSRALSRHLEAAWDALGAAGVEVQDHLGQPFDPGLRIKVVAFQPTPGLGREQVVEAVRPTVYLDGRLLRPGEVIVGTPVNGDAPAHGGTTAHGDTTARGETPAHGDTTVHGDTTGGRP
ncbi:nucleotide exchange factor GrpE [Actinomadura hibisca]|uniref:nucleotide exchange factor GrpE n=1 Tax=Actinomadura hibisca TaxID=68565 RepID=UPI000836644C|nr:nucleotide exchange factor GrpE [Actinomadura hibisca]